MTGIAAMYEQFAQDDDSFRTNRHSDSFSQELCMEALMLLVVTITSLHGMLLVILSLVVNVWYRKCILHETILPLLSSRTGTGEKGMAGTELADLLQLKPLTADRNAWRSAPLPQRCRVVRCGSA